MKKLKRKFNKAWKHREAECVHNAIQAATEYYQNIENEKDMINRVELLTVAFYDPPSVDNVAKEKQMTSPKNIIFLYIAARLEEQGATLSDVVFTCDKDGKGYLTYDEFTIFITSFGIPLTDIQIKQVIEGVDKDKGGNIELKELEESIKEIDVLGQPNCPWKFYVDPATDVLCYRNFQTGIRT